MMMFSENNRISIRQVFRNYCVLALGISALFIPVPMNDAAMPSILLAIVLLGLYLAGTEICPAPEYGILKAVSYVHYWILGTLTVRMTGLLVQEFLLDGVSLWLILGLFYAACYYNLYKGLECRMRVGEILFWPFLLLLAGLSIAMHGEAEVSRVRELAWVLDGNGIRKGYELFCLLTAVQRVWYVKDRIPEKCRAAGRIYIAGAAGVLFWALFTCCIYGNAGHTGLVFPLASAMTLAHFPGNVIGRLDTIFVFAWVIGLFIACSTLFAPLRAEEPDRRKKYMLAVLLAASMALAVRQESQVILLNLLYKVSMPVQILLLFLQLGKRYGKRMLIACIGLLSIFVTGCGHQELEKENLTESICVNAGVNKAYEVTFGFDAFSGEVELYQTEADSLQDARTQYADSHEKDLDFNHLKNFYFSESLLREDAFGILLTEIQTDGTYSRGTSVWVTEGDPAEAAKEEEQPEEGMPIHRMLNAWYNREPFRPYFYQKK